MKLYGRDWTRRELEARVGRIEQIGGVRRLQWDEGPEQGVVHYQVRTGAGMTYYVSPSRGLDISLTEFGGFPISWQAPTGDVHPAYYDAQGAGWLRTAVGGLLMTCGLDYVGAPEVDQGQAYPLHGRIHHIPAYQVSSSSRWIGDEYEFQVSGEMKQVAVFGEHLQLNRTITSRLGENQLTIHDVVQNVGFETTPHMILYHFNFGFPLLSEKTQINYPSSKVIGRDEGTPVEGYDTWHAPQPNYAERVYYHLELADGPVTASIFNPVFPSADGGSIPLTVSLGWSTQQLPKLVEWKMPGEGTHVLGIEPSNCYVEGRSKEREMGTLDSLDPGETREYELSLLVTVESQLSTESNN